MSGEPPQPTLRQELDRAVADVRRALPAGSRPRVGMVLGSGLGAFADTLRSRVVVPAAAVRGFLPASVEGHAGNLVYGLGGDGQAGLGVLVLQGRVHFYEGHDLGRVVFPVRTLIACGCRTIVLTNAAGGIDPALAPGDVVVLRDHLNLMGGSPLRGPNDASCGPRFPDLTEAYDPALRRLALAAGAEIGLELREGVYAGLPGPAYETPAEVRMLRVLGADLAGMSTVPETIAAVHMGARVLGLSLVSNLAAGLGGGRLSHDEVMETAARARPMLERLLGRVLAKLEADFHAESH